MQTVTIHKQTVKELLNQIFEGDYRSEIPVDLSRDEFERLEKVSDELGQLRLLLDLGEEYDDLDDLEWAITEVQSWL